jgi:hypothetical protein
LLRERYPDIPVKERAIRRYVARLRATYRPKEVFIRQLYQAGDQTQYDFKDVQAVIAGVVVDLNLFSARLSFSKAWFARCYMTEDQPALFDGIQRTAVAFNGVTKEGVFDNAATAIDKVLPSRTRRVNETFAAFIGSYATTMQYAAPRKGNEKGGVEGLHGYIEDNFFRPMPSFPSLEALNDALLARSVEDRSRRGDDGLSIQERFEQEQGDLHPLPNITPRACIIESVKVNKFSEVRHKTNRYSVPSALVGQVATLEIFATRIRIIVDHRLVAEHDRLIGKNGAALDPMHYLDVLEFKHRAVERAEVLTNGSVPLPLRQLLRRLVADNRDTAGKHFVSVLRLMEDYPRHEVLLAVEEAEKCNVLDPHAIALFLIQKLEIRIEPIPFRALPLKAQITAPAVHLSQYETSLLAEAA